MVGRGRSLDHSFLNDKITKKEEKLVAGRESWLLVLQVIRDVVVVVTHVSFEWPNRTSWLELPSRPCRGHWRQSADIRQPLWWY